MWTTVPANVHVNGVHSIVKKYMTILYFIQQFFTQHTTSQGGSGSSWRNRFHEINTFRSSWNAQDFPVRGQVTMPSFFAAISSSASLE